MIDEEYRGYNLTAVRHGGMWQVSIYPLSVGQIVPKPRGRRAAQAVAREDAFIEARRRVDALLAARAVLKRGAWPSTATAARHVLTLPLVLAGLASTLTFDPDALTDHCLAAILAYLSFRGLAAAYRRLRGRDGLGGGDAKLIAGAGAWCGLAALPLVVLGSALLGLLAALGLALTGRSMTSTTRIPFGPCIALAFWLVRMHGALAEDLLRLLGRF